MDRVITDNDMSFHQVKARLDEIDRLRAKVEALKAALTEISEMGEGYATAMVITADKALDALREGE